MSIKLSIPQGMRDFDACTIYKRQYIINTAKKYFARYGFEPLETPAMENLETLMEKYGEEGDKLIFKILNNGLHESKKKEDILAAFQQLLEQPINCPTLTERALRYDLTIPLARFIAMNKNNVLLPYKRYQIQPVWRADRPQLGRYREFYQCDADTIGNPSLICEVELLCLYAEVFNELQIPITISVNHRQIFKALNTACYLDEKDNRLITLIDKIDKIGIEKFNLAIKENLQLEKQQIDIVQQYLQLHGDIHKIKILKTLFPESNYAQKAFNDLENIFSLIPQQYQQQIIFDTRLARGLDYYTGCIFEVKANNMAIGSLGGGGRYDNLTALFGVPNIEGVGISFGIDRIYDTLEKSNLFPNAIHSHTQVLFFNMGEKESHFAFEKMQHLRSLNIRCELFHKADKMDKQFKYAERKNIPFVIIIGEQEINHQQFILKNIYSGNQQTLSWEELIQYDFEF